VETELAAPLITIGITCFNAADTILRSVKSALAQDWPNFEVVIADDGSVDGSIDVILAAIANESRATLIGHKSNAGPAASRNTIVSAAKGEFIAFSTMTTKVCPAAYPIKSRLSPPMRAWPAPG
jgi:glycosyltransferase involved in cell wall biosynthesis